MGHFEEIEEMDNNPLELTHASVIANFSGRSIICGEGKIQPGVSLYW